MLYSANVTEAIDRLADNLTAAMGSQTGAMLGMGSAWTTIGNTFLLIALILIPVALTFAMFQSRDLMLGFPSAIFWAVLGGYAYTQSTATWDIYYFIFFASMGMTIFSMYAMYGLRAKDLAGPDTGKEKFFDEEGEPDLRGDAEKDDSEPKPSKRVQRIRKRATGRRSSRTEEFK